MSFVNRLSGKKEPQRQPFDPNQFLRAFEQFVTASTWDESQRIVEGNPLLLDPQADDLLRQLTAAMPDPQTRQVMEERSALLRRCREASIPHAFAEKMLSPKALAQAQAEGITPEQLLTRAEPADSRPPVPPKFQDELRRAQEVEQRYRRSGDRSALDSATTAWLRILDHPEFASSDDRFQLEVMNHAGRVFLWSYWAGGRLAELDQALRLWQQTVQRTPADSPNLPMYVNNLGNGLRDRYTRSGDLADLQEAIRVYQQAVQATPADSPALPAFLNNLGLGLRDRYARSGDLDDLAEAIRASQQAVQHTPHDSPDLPSCLSNLGNGLRDRYTRSGDLADLAEALRVYQQAVQHTPPDSPALPGLLSNLGLGLRDRYARSGDLADLAEAIRVSQQAVQRTPADSPDLPARLNNLGLGLRDRYTRRGDLVDLQEAILVSQQAVQRTWLDSPDLPSRLSNLGNGLRDRYARSGDLADLVEAIRVSQQAVQRTPPNSPGLPGRLNNLGFGLSARYARSGDLSDLAEAIRVYQQAVQRTPADSSDLPGYLNNLGNDLSARYARSGALADLEEAIGAYQTAVQRTPPDSPDLPGYLNNLGNGFRDRYARSGALADLEEARERYRVACQRGLEVTPEEALRSARNWGNWALQRLEWQEAAEAYDYGRRAIDGLFTTQTSREAKESWLREARGLPVNAAYALAKLDWLTEAVETIEAGRARLLAEALEQNRRDLEQLEPLGHKAVLDRYRAASERVTALQQQASQPATQSLRDSSQSPNQPVTRFDYSAWRQQLEQARAELDAAIDAIRQVPGYHDFFLTPDFSAIQRAARPDEPLVYLVTTPAGSVALVVRAQPSQKPGFSEKPGFSTVSPVSAVWLDDLTETDLRAAIYGPADGPGLSGYLGAYDHWLRNPRDAVARQSWFDTLDQTTRWLWDAVMGPVIGALWTTSSPSPQPSPQGEGAGEGVTLIPAGLLALLPLHAAWTEDGDTASGRRYALDVLSITYAASARALSDARGLAASVAVDGILAVDNPDGSLVFSHQEVEAVRSYFPAAQSTVLPGTAATQQAVLDGLPRHSVFHFSTHGRAGWSEPLESSLLLAGGAHLTLRDLLDQRLAGARLAVLSACETGVPGTQLVDEVVSLPSGFAQAGVAGVVASLWAVNDMSTAMLMERFYRLWREDGLTPGEALRQAQIWLRDATNQEMIAYFDQDVLPALARMPAAVAANFAFSREEKRAPDSREFAHPFWWAAFTMTGA